MHGQALLQRAVGLHRAGKLDEAATIYTHILQSEPRNDNALNLLSVVERQRGNVRRAIELAHAAVTARPRTADYFFNLAECYRAAALFNEAVDAYRQSLAVNNRDHEVWHALGVCLTSQGFHNEAAQNFRQAVGVRPDFVLAYEDLGASLARAGDFSGAINACRRAISLAPSRPEAHIKLAAVMTLKGDLDTALAAYHHASRLDPRNVTAAVGVSQTLNRMGKRDQAEIWGRRSIELDPANLDALNHLGMALEAQGKLSEAISYFQRAIDIAPSSADGYTNLAGALLQCRQHARAVELYRKAAELAPTSAAEQSNLLLAMNYPDDIDEAELFAEHSAWGKAAVGRVSTRRAPVLDRDDSQMVQRRVETRPTRLGYVSPDLREHPVSYFVEPILANHNRDRFEVLIYSDVARPDGTTQRLKALVPHWKDVRHLNDEQLAELIRADGIDILVDLAGHTAKNRLIVFAQKPAPVQMTYLGYPNTTGLPASIMSYRITDGICDPPVLSAVEGAGVADQLHTEQLLRIESVGSALRTDSREQCEAAPDCETGRSDTKEGPQCGPYMGPFLCYHPPADAPRVSPRPCEKNGYITFGSFSSLHKVTPRTVELWAQILQHVPDSRLLLKNKSLADAAATTPLQQEFSSFGISEDRLALRTGVKEHSEHLAQYANIDIALDTFPYHGTTTTCEALWMGVPVITLAGQSHRSRVGVSLLSAIGAPELIVDSRERHVQIAIELANDLQRLNAYRRDLRDRMAASPLRDERAFVARLEEVYLHLLH